MCQRVQLPLRSPGCGPRGPHVGTGSLEGGGRWGGCALSPTVSQPCPLPAREETGDTCRQGAWSVALGHPSGQRCRRKWYGSVQGTGQGAQHAQAPHSRPPAFTSLESRPPGRLGKASVVATHRQGHVCAERRTQECRSLGVPWAAVAGCGTCGVLGTSTPGEAGGAPGPGDFKVWGSLSPSCAYGKGVACVPLSLYSVPTWSRVRSGSRGHFCWDQAGEAGRLRVPQDVLREEKGQ